MACVQALPQLSHGDVTSPASVWEDRPLPSDDTSNFDGLSVHLLEQFNDDLLQGKLLDFDFDDLNSLCTHSGKI